MLEAIRRAIEAGDVEILTHASDRMATRKRPFRLIAAAITRGTARIVEVQHNDPRGIAYVVRCRTPRGPVHAVFGIEDEAVRLITILIPPR